MAFIFATVFEEIVQCYANLLISKYNDQLIDKSVEIQLEHLHELWLSVVEMEKKNY